MSIEKKDILELIKQAQDYYEQVEPDLIRDFQLYNADRKYYSQKFPKLTKRSFLVSRDVADVVEWAIPQLMRLFFGLMDVIFIKGRTPEDQQVAQVMNQLVNYQIKMENSGYRIFYNWFKDALITGTGVVKAWWVREWDEVVEQQVVGEDELQLAQQDPNIEILDVQDMGNGLFNVRMQGKILRKNKPVIKNIPLWEVMFTPARDITECDAVIHRKEVTTDYIKNKYGKKEGEKGDFIDSALREYFYKNITKKEDLVTLYEVYVKENNKIYTLLGEEIIKEENNIYKRPPFFVINPIFEPHQIYGSGYADRVQDIQDLKSAILMQILINTALANDPKVVIDDARVNVADIISDKQVIRAKGDVRAVLAALNSATLANWTFDFLELLEELKEARVGITKYNTGLDPRAFSHTATGASLMLQASNRRLELIARNFLETGVKDLIRFLIMMNNMFIDQKTVVRLTGASLPVRLDDIENRFDLIITSAVDEVFSIQQQQQQPLQQQAGGAL